MSDGEIENFLRFLSFSSITTTDASGLSATNTNFQFKTYMNDFVSKEILSKYEQFLSIPNMSKISTFSNINGFGSLNLQVHILGLQMIFSINTSNYENIIIGFDDDSGSLFHKRFARDWAKLNLAEYYNKIKYNRRAKYNFLELLEIKLDENMNFEEKLENYKKEVIRNFDIVLPKFALYFQTSHTLRKSLMKFARSLSINLKKEFPKNDGWDVDLASSFDLGGAKTFITHEDWGENPLYISLESKKSCFGSLHINLNKNELGRRYDYSDLFDRLKKDFGKGECDDEYFFSFAVEQKYENLVQGNIYDLEEKSFIDEQNSQEFIKYICEKVTKFKTYFEEIKILSLR